MINLNVEQRCAYKHGHCGVMHKMKNWKQQTSLAVVQKIMFTMAAADTSQWLRVPCSTRGSELGSC